MNNREKDVTRRAIMLIVTMAMFLLVSCASVSLDWKPNPWTDNLWILSNSITSKDNIGPISTNIICTNLFIGFLFIIMISSIAKNADVICTDRTPKSWRNFCNSQLITLDLSNIADVGATMLCNRMLVVMMWGMNMNFLETMNIKSMIKTPETEANAMSKSKIFMLFNRVW